MPTTRTYNPDFADPEMLYEALLGARRVAAAVRTQYDAAEEACSSAESTRLQALLMDADMAENALQALYDAAEAAA